MTDRIVECNAALEKVRQSFSDKENLLPFVGVTEDNVLKRGCDLFYILQSIINQSLQTGNYRRAVRYLLLLKRADRKLEALTGDISRRLTDHMLK